MLDVIGRACRHPIDYSGICRVTNLKFVEKRQESGDIHSFLFKADRLPGWKAGQHAIFTLPGKKVTGKTWRPFSVASAPHEGIIRIGTIISPEPSSFKQHLMSLQAGDRVRMYGPYGELYVRHNMKKVVGVAGGIGITPFRSIIADMAKSGNLLDFHLIYSAKTDHTYKTELEAWKTQLPNLKITFVNTPTEVNAALEKEVATNKNGAHYLLSGAPGMIEALRQSLLRQDVSRHHILHDPFKGY